MKKTRYSEEQIIGVLKQMEAGRKVSDLARELGVSEGTLYAWESKFGGLEVSEARRLVGQRCSVTGLMKDFNYSERQACTPRCPMIHSGVYQPSRRCRWRIFSECVAANRARRLAAAASIITRRSASQPRVSWDIKPCDI
jgi:hypothetical protein